jgi:hypothetical protein
MKSYSLNRYRLTIKTIKMKSLLCKHYYQLRIMEDYGIRKGLNDSTLQKKVTDQLIKYSYNQ